MFTYVCVGYTVYVRVCVWPVPSTYFLNTFLFKITVENKAIAAMRADYGREARASFNIPSLGPNKARARACVWLLQ